MATPSPIRLASAASPGALVSLLAALAAVALPTPAARRRRTIRSLGRRTESTRTTSNPPPGRPSGCRVCKPCRSEAAGWAAP